MIAEADVKKLYSVEEYLEIASSNGQRYELVKGELIKMSGASRFHSRVCATIIAYLWNFVNQHQLGEVCDSDAKYETVPAPPGSKRATVRQPDVSFVSTNRVPNDSEIMKAAPDLAIEVISPSNTFSEIENKIDEYFAVGGELVWVVSLEKQRVYVHRNDSPLRQTLTANDELDGENVLPGFKLKVADLFI